jgi:hypothetical protein
LAASQVTTRCAVSSPGDSPAVTRGFERRTGPVVRMRTSRQMPMLLSGGHWVQSTQPMDKSVIGLPGCTRYAMVLVPLRTR